VVLVITVKRRHQHRGVQEGPQVGDPRVRRSRSPRALSSARLVSSIDNLRPLRKTHIPRSFRSGDPGRNDRRVRLSPSDSSESVSPGARCSASLSALGMMTRPAASIVTVVFIIGILHGKMAFINPYGATFRSPWRSTTQSVTFGYDVASCGAL
jgi:hypothetical protein